MPAQSSDPIATALHRSLSASKKCGGLTKDEALDSMLVASAKQVLFTEIKYAATKSYNTTVLSDLKSKYIVLSTAGNQGGGQQQQQQQQQQQAPQGVGNASPKKQAREVVSLPAAKRVLYPPEAVQLGWRGVVPVGSGFVNLGNTCYLNSTLQALFHVPAFVNWLLNDSTHTAKCELINGMTHSECLICAMSKTLAYSHKCTGSAIKPLQIYSKLKSICKNLTQGHQEDAHEFLRYLIEGMERSYLTIFNALKLDTYSKETTPLNQIFGGYLRTEVTCLECHYVSTTFQHFQDLLLDIRQVTTVDEALDSYFSRESLGDGEHGGYKCEQCHRRVAAMKKFSLERPPKVLCVQLKRFGTLGGKNSKHINLKQWLDLNRFRHRSAGSQPTPIHRYKLVGMVTHVGPSASYGHYTAVGLSSVGSYYFFDDSVVSQVKPLSLHNVLSTNAYIIMYEQEVVPEKVVESPKITVVNGHSNGIQRTEVKALEINGNSGPVYSPQKAIPLPAPSPDRKAVLQQLVAVAGQNSLKKSSEEKDKEKTEGGSGGGSPSSRSLVPYLSESSESESEASSLTSPERGGSSPAAESTPAPPPPPPPQQHGSPNTPKGNVPKNSPAPQQPSTPVKSNKTVGNKWSSPGKSDGSTNGSIATNGDREAAKRGGGWEVTPVPRIATIGNSSGRWNITSNEPQLESSGVNDNDQQSNAGSSSLSTMNNLDRSRDRGVKKSNATMEELLSMNHRGYGTNVSSWNGSRSEIDRQVNSERMKRSHRSDSYDEELDRGKAKKHKKNHYDDKDHHQHYQQERGKYPQDFRYRKWGKKRGGGGSGGGNRGSRQNFYRNYTYERSRPYYRQEHERSWR